MLAYILVEGRTPRDKLIGLLWGDVPDSKARNAFRQALHRLRGALGDSVIPQDPEALYIAENSSIETDLEKFEGFFSAGEMEKAIGEYRGDFLSSLDVREPSFDSWLESTRKRFRARFRDALRRSIQADLESGEMGRAVNRASTLSQLDAVDPDGAILFATTLLGAGRRAEALHALEEFEKKFREEMDLAAPPAVREMLTRLRRAPAPQPARGPTRTRTRFVGREPELALLLGRIRSLESDGGSVIVVEGERGVGKTRLVDEFFARAADFGSPLLLVGRERSPDAAIAYASVAEALRGVLETSGVAGTGQHLLAEAARLLPQLRDRFSLPAIADIVDDAGRLRFYEGIAALLDSVAYEQPVCIALDDFHNCSGTTFGLVQYLVERLQSSPILFIFAGKPTAAFTQHRVQLLESPANKESGANGRAGALIALGPLDEADARDLVGDLTGAAADATTIEEILASSGGIPFRIIEAAERLRAGDTIDRTPVRLRDVLWSRLQRCTQAEQRLFVTVALFDRPVPIRLLAAASHLPEQSALDAALNLEKLGFLYQRPEGMSPAHDFAGELALEGTGPAGRALLAGWAAEALEREGSGSAGELARLFALAGRRKEAFLYSRAAAYEAVAAGARDEGIRYFETALATAPTSAEREEMDAMLRSLGGGTLRLFGRVSPRKEARREIPPRPSPRPIEVASAEEVGETIPGAGAVPPGAAARPLPRWRYVVPIALGFAAVSLVLFRLAPAARRGTTPGTSLADTLVVAREIDPRDTVIAFTTGQLGAPLSVLEGATRHGRTRAWVDSLRLPWINPLPSPDGRSVSLEKITKEGSDLYVVSADRRDTIALNTGNGDDFASGWSPDSRWLLATHGQTRADGSYGSDLYGYSVVERGKRIVFDTSAARGVVEASWSPDGSHVAWTARVGSQHQQDIFVSDADGHNLANVTDNPGEDYSIAWSPDGSTLAFTSERSGRAELYSVNIASHLVRRLTWEGAHADHALFSPDGRWLAYESTKGGSPAVYVMPSGGGTGRSVTPAPARITLVGWQGGTIPYVDQLRLDVPPLSRPGDAGELVVRALDRQGNAVRTGSVRFQVLDPRLVRIEANPDGGSSEGLNDSITVRALARGLARIAVSAGSWRSDTAFVPIGDETLALLSENFEHGLQRESWKTLGAVTPIILAGAGANASSGLLARSNREWESGVLSRAVFRVHRGLTVDVWVRAPFTQPVNAARSFVVALVAADPEEVIDSAAPKFLRLATVSWLGEAGRLSYSVGREIFTEPLIALGKLDIHRISIGIGADDLVTIRVDGRQRWKSSLRVRTEGDNSRAQLWLASKASANGVVFDDVEVRLARGKPPGPPVPTTQTP